MDTAYAAAYERLYRHHWWWRTREAILLRTLADLLDEARPGRILDVGCGAGLFFDALERFGHVEGIESDAELVQQSGRWRDRIRAGELDESFRPDAPFDMILMLDVLEHVNNPEQLLGLGARLLAPGGRIVITVPAFTSLWTSHDDLNHHLRRYTANQLRQTIRDTGLLVESTSYLFQSLVIPKLMVRVIERTRGGPPHVPRTPAPVVNNLLRRWFLAERRVSRWLPFGTSVMAVARRA